MNDMMFTTKTVVEARLILKELDWLVRCFEDLRRFSNLSAISRLGSRRLSISAIIDQIETGNRTPDLLLRKPRA